MGLDLQLYAIKKGVNLKMLESNADYYNKVKSEGNYVELSYGRKTWELALMFDGAVQAKGYSVPVAKETYQKIIDTLSYYTVEDYERIVHFEEEGDYDLDKEDAKFFEDFICWYEATFDASPQLGYGWAANAFKNWLMDYPKAIQYFDKPDWDVYVYASY